MNKTFCIFIISNGRPDNVITYKTLMKAGCTYPIFILIDDMDQSFPKYFKNYGDKVLVFDKKAIASKVDNGDNFDNLRTTTHARNACFEKAEELGYTYFLVLDDDYTQVKYRINSKSEYPKDVFLIKTTLDHVIDAYLGFYMNSKQIKSLCMAQGGDFIGGEQSNAHFRMKRKAMNSFFCSTSRPFTFVSRLNEDVNTYLSLGKIGDVFCTCGFVAIDQLQTQSNEGGMTEAYIDGGTFVKSFYTVMYCPSFAKIGTISQKNPRIHHSINWSNAVPVILRESHKKK